MTAATIPVGARVTLTDPNRPASAVTGRTIAQMHLTLPTQYAVYTIRRDDGGLFRSEGILTHPAP